MKESRVMPLYPSGTNSTHFTTCCTVAITASERCCPGCNAPVTGHAEKFDHDRARIRWREATKGWKR